MNETLPSAGAAGNARYLALIVLLVVAVALTVAGWLATERSEAENRTALAAELGRVARSLPELAQEAAHGADGAIARLQAASERLGRLAAAQDRGDVDGPAKAQVLGIDVDRRVVYACAAVSVLLLVLLLQQQVGDARRRAREIEHRNVDTERRKEQTDDQNRRNQDAILRLLDEMGGLAEGDLTVQASVTEDITGAIADSINYAIEALRELVTTINATSERVAAAVVETRAVADRLAEAAQAQARQIEASNTTVAQMAQALDAVSGKTSTSAEVAHQSAGLAREGGERVRRTMHGMDAIREHIQETSKRIKRLGESSQEIGDIVELINDIADQTNILALNAAIQASAAGEAGRGFAVVADEVQRLAERSGHATRRIEALVKTIQADTNEAIISMEKSTTEVVNGAGLAEKAGEALGEIESVAARLAALIAEISTAATEVSTMAGRVAVSMEAINATTAETAAGGATTARAMGELSSLAQDLRQSVAGFRLPGAGAA